MIHGAGKQLIHGNEDLEVGREIPVICGLSNLNLPGIASPAQVG